MRVRGQRDITVDKKGRLVLPRELKEELSAHVVLSLAEDSCIRIDVLPFTHEADLSAVLVSVEKDYYSGPRVCIPKVLRQKSVSFFYGRTVTLVGKGDYLEVWPRPNSSK